MSKKVDFGDGKGFITHLVNEFGLDLLCHIRGDLEQRRDIAILAIDELLQQKNHFPAYLCRSRYAGCMKSF